MKTARGGRERWQRGALAALCCLGWAALAGPLAAQQWSEFGPPAPPEPPTDPRIQEPFFEFLIAAVEADSFGTWAGQQIRAAVRASGRTSRFPLAEVVLVARRVPDAVTLKAWTGEPVAAVWELALTSDLDRPMPYDILGYHPGSLRISSRLQLVELAVGRRSLHYDLQGREQSEQLQDIRIFALVAGSVVLDVHSVVDALLGSALDDAWTVGFVTARQGLGRLGLGVSLGRRDRKIYGEFDFAEDKVRPHGRPLASALSAYCRRWLRPEDGRLPRPWP